MAKRNFTVEIDEEFCKGCNLCVEFCPKNVFTTSEPHQTRILRPRSGKSIRLHWLSSLRASLPRYGDNHPHQEGEKIEDCELTTPAPDPRPQGAKVKILSRIGTHFFIPYNQFILRQ